MKLTKVLREYVEEQMSKARREADKEASASYKKRREDVEAEIKEYLAEVVNPHIEAILKANDMDLEVSRYGDKMPSAEAILSLFSQYILNSEEKKALDEAERKRCTKQTEAMKRFAIECELGIEKDEFYDKVAELAKEVK
jgi:hypothetical protein